MRKKPSSVFYFTVLLFFSGRLSSQEPGLIYYNQISPDSMKESVFILSSDSMMGRETGREGQKKAAIFLASKYKLWGLNPGAIIKHTANEPQIEANDFMQDHPISIKNNKKRNLTVRSENFLFGKDFVYSDSGPDSTLFINEFYFIGINNRISPETVLDEDKFANRNIIITDQDSTRNSFVKPFSNSNKKPSSLFIIVEDEKIKELFYQNTTQDSHPKFPCIFVSRSIANKIFSSDKYSRALKKTGHRNKPVIIKLKCESSISIVSKTEEMRGQNIIAFIEGYDTTGETVVISSHYDHLGVRDSLIYFGADDNASGTSAVLEIARIFSLAKKNGLAPKRNLLFLNVSGEEKGLLGSSWYVDNPPAPIENTIANLNIDMIGRTDPYHDSTGVRNYVYIIGSDKMSSELHNINEAENSAGPKLELNYRYNTKDDPNQFYKRSDHFNFVKKGIPVIFYFNGTHSDYHKPTDTPDKIDFELLTNRTRLIFLTAWELANRAGRITVDKSGDPENK